MTTPPYPRTPKPRRVMVPGLGSGTVLATENRNNAEWLRVQFETVICWIARDECTVLS